MRARLNPSLEAEVVPHRSLPVVPRWLLKDRLVLVSPARDTREYEAAFADTVGAGDWAGLSDDTLRFHPEHELVLDSIKMAVPPVNLSSPELLEPWRSVTPAQGLLRLSAATDFQLPSTRWRCFTADGAYLAAVTPRILDSVRVALALRVAPDFDLLFADGLYCGWLLAKPARHLVRGWEPSPEGEPDPRVAAWLGELLRVTDDPNIVRALRGEPVVAEPLKRIREQLERVPAGPQRDVLMETIADLTIRFG
jgi:hypothetical protein